MLILIFIYLNPLLMHLYYFFDDGSVGSVLFDIALMFTLLGPSTLWTWVSTVVGSVHVVDMYKFVTLVWSVHYVDWGHDPWWRPSTLWTCISLWPCLGPSISWTCISLWPWLGSSISWTGVMTLGRVRLLYGLINLWPWLGPSIMWTVVLTFGGVRPLCGLE